jgi:hypothetical protein
MARTIEFTTKYPQISEFTSNDIVYATLKQLRSDMEKLSISKTIPTIEKVIKTYDIDGVRAGKAVFYNKKKAMKVLNDEFNIAARREKLKRVLDKL